MIGRRGKQVIFIIGLSLAGGIIANSQETVLRDNQIERGAPGEGSRKETVTYETDGSSQEYRMELEIEEREWTDEEWQKYFEEGRKEAETLFLSENENAAHVADRVNLCESVQNGLIHVQWTFGKDNQIDTDGNILEANITEGEPVLVMAELSAQERSGIYEFPICLYRKELTEEELCKEEVAAYTKSHEESSEILTLPDTSAGKTLRWHVRHTHTGGILVLLGCTASVGILCADKYEQQKKRKRQEQELQKDYPGIVSCLGLLMEAGMSLQQAWKRMAQDYEKKKCAHRIKRREGYEQMLITLHEFEDGVGETKACEHFGERCGAASYRRLASVLVQNQQKGCVGIGHMLTQEAEQAYGQKRNMARRLGEEAGTKLLFPMMLMLILVLVILIIPACMSM